MTRLFIYIGLSLGVTALLAWLAAIDGTVTIDMAGYRLQPGLGTVGILLLAFTLCVIAIWAILRRIIEAPKRLVRAAARRRREIGVEALSEGYIALEAGNPTRARQQAREAQLRMPTNAAAQLLEARAELAMGELPAAREHYRALISNPKTALAALSGLYDQARAQGRADISLTFAKKAMALTSGVLWAEAAVFDDLTAQGAWADALEMVSARPTPTKIARTTKKRQQAVLNTALATDLETTDPMAALACAQTALKLAPDLVPAALVAARIHINRDEVRKAQALLRRLWRQTAHPHIALLFANAQPGASAVDRLKRAKDLIGVTPESEAGALTLARAAIDAYEWDTARKVLDPYRVEKPGRATCVLMAEIEEGQSGDQGQARGWLARAVHAKPDPAWVADGMVSEDWVPVSPVSGRLDAFEWKPPASMPKAGNSQSHHPAPALPSEQGSSNLRLTSETKALTNPSAKPLASPPQSQ